MLTDYLRSKIYLHRNKHLMAGVIVKCKTLEFRIENVMKINSLIISTIKITSVKLILTEETLDNT